MHEFQNVLHQNELFPFRRIQYSKGRVMEFLPPGPHSSVVAVAGTKPGQRQGPGIAPCFPTGFRGSFRWLTGSGLLSNPALAVTGVWGANQQIESSLSVSVYFLLSEFFKIRVFCGRISVSLSSLFDTLSFKYISESNDTVIICALWTLGYQLPTGFLTAPS